MGPGSIEFSDVSFGYRRSRRVLSGFSASFTAGRTLLLGPNGAGKSTILGLAATVLHPARGLIRVNGVAATGGGVRDCRRLVAWMPQRIRPLPGFTAREQVAYVGWLKGLRRAEAWERSADALARSGLRVLAERPATQLSGGELRRMGIAQTVVSRAPWVLMDEPSAGLDPVQREEFADALARLDDDINLVISTHQTDDLLPTFTSVMVVADGRMRFCGSLGDLLDDEDGATDAHRLMAAYRRLVRTDQAVAHR